MANVIITTDQLVLPTNLTNIGTPTSGDFFLVFRGSGINFVTRAMTLDQFQTLIDSSITSKADLVDGKIPSTQHPIS